MYLGKVIGSIWGTKQAQGLEGLKLLTIRPTVLRPQPNIDPLKRRLTPPECELSEKVIVAADTLGAGPGEYVIVATGTRVRDVVYDTKKPIKAVVIAIVDSADINVGEVR